MLELLVSIAVCEPYCDMRDVQLVVRFTRLWIHYGFLGHTFVCILVAALEGLMGR